MLKSTATTPRKTRKRTGKPTRWSANPETGCWIYSTTSKGTWNPALRTAAPALTEFAATIGRNFALPGWAVLAATLALPALQAGGFAGLVSRVLRKGRVAIS